MTQTELPILWYENEAGERWIPNDLEFDPPAGFVYQHSRLPLVVTHSVLRVVLQEEVDACDHLHTKPDFGIIDSMEGRQCLHCHGYQSKQKWEMWPNEWKAIGSRPVFSSGSSASDSLVTQLVRNGMMASEAILRAAVACEGCMNVMAHEAGLDWGYERGSEEHQKCRTSCELCQ